jgi:hypothetical protein
MKEMIKKDKKPSATVKKPQAVIHYNRRMGHVALMIPAHLMLPKCIQLFLYLLDITLFIAFTTNKKTKPKKIEYNQFKFVVAELLEELVMLEYVRRGQPPADNPMRLQPSIYQSHSKSMIHKTSETCIKYLSMKYSAFIGLDTMNEFGGLFNDTHSIETIQHHMVG